MAKKSTDKQAEEEKLAKEAADKVEQERISKEVSDKQAEEEKLAKEAADKVIAEEETEKKRLAKEEKKKVEIEWLVCSSGIDFVKSKGDRERVSKVKAKILIEAEQVKLV